MFCMSFASVNANVNANVIVIVSSILSVSVCYHNCVNIYVELFE